MQNIETGLFTWNWWISVGLVAVILHLLATYASRVLDKVFGAARRGWNGRSQRARDEIERKVQLLVDERESQSFVRDLEFRHRLRTLQWLGLACFSLILAFGARAVAPADPLELGRSIAKLMLGFGIILLFLAMNENTHASKLYYLLQRAWDRENEVGASRKTKRQKDAPKQPGGAP